MRRLFAVGLKELWQVLRDVRTLTIMLLMPIFFLWLYGYALNFDIRNVTLAVEDDDHTAASREIIAAFVNSGYFDLVATVRSTEEIVDILNRDVARAVLVIPRGAARALDSSEGVAIQVLVNGDNANTATTVIGYASAIIRGVSARLQLERGQTPPAPPLVTLEPRVWYNPQLESTLFLVPGLVAYIAMITAVISTALSIVKEKEKGTMEQIRMSPLGTLTFIVGKSLPYFVLSFLSSMAILIVAMLFFDVPMRGSWLWLVISTGLFLMSALSLGLFVSTLADSQQVAFQLALIISFLPTFILSGFIFPIASMPTFIQIVSFIVPARYYLVALRGIVLKGVSVETIAPQLVALFVLSTFVLLLASIRLARENRA